jgi:hypothetical protein
MSHLASGCCCTPPGWECCHPAYLFTACTAAKDAQVRLQMDGWITTTGAVYCWCGSSCDPDDLGEAIWDCMEAEQCQLPGVDFSGVDSSPCAYFAKGRGIRQVTQIHMDVTLDAIAHGYPDVGCYLTFEGYATITLGLTYPNSTYDQSDCDDVKGTQCNQTQATECYVIAKLTASDRWAVEIYPPDPGDHGTGNWPIPWSFVWPTHVRWSEPGQGNACTDGNPTYYDYSFACGEGPDFGGCASCGTEEPERCHDVCGGGMEYSFSTFGGGLTYGEGAVVITPLNWEIC